MFFHCEQIIRALLITLETFQFLSRIAHEPSQQNIILGKFRERVVEKIETPIYIRFSFGISDLSKMTVDLFFY